MKIKAIRTLVCAATAIAVLVPTAVRATEPVASAAPQGEPPAYTLFTGADINVLHEGVLCRVRDVAPGAFIIRANGADVKVPLGTDSQQIKISAIQQLSDRLATVAKYKYERTYTPANDPYQKFLAETRGKAAAQESAGMAAAIRDKLPATTVVQSPMGGGSRIQANPESAPAAAAASNASIAVSGDTGDYAFYLQRLADERAKELYDAISIDFEVSTNKPLTNPYLVIMATFHEKGDSKYKRNLLLTKPLDRIDAKPQAVSVREGGLPRGFIIDSLQVHLYQNGREVATTLSEHQAALTRDEAHEYLVIEYVTANKKATKEPRIALARLPEDWSAHRQDEASHRVHYVKVDKTGRAGGAFEDKTCTTKVNDAYYENLLKGVLFLPALKDGQAVDGVAAIKLGDVSL